MFTIEDICLIAVQIEQNGEATYRRAADTVVNPEIRKIILWMADEEHRHGKWFEKVVIQPKQTSSAEYEEMKALGRSLLQEMLKDQTFSLKGATLIQTGDEYTLIEQSIEFEKDTITFYEMLLGFVEDDDVRQQLNHIIDEEKNHVTQLQGMQRAE